MESTTPRRTRDAEATRRDLLAAARELFAREGYDQVGVRAIAERAGVNQALLNRYFGGKAGLFGAVVENLFREPAILEGDRARFGQSMATYLFAKRSEDAADPLGLLLRSSANPEAAAILREALDRTVVDALANWLPGPEAQARAGAIVVVLMGVSVMRWLIGSKAMTGDPASAQADLVARVLQAIVDGDV